MISVHCLRTAPDDGAGFAGTAGGKENNTYDSKILAMIRSVLCCCILSAALVAGRAGAQPFYDARDTGSPGSSFIHPGMMQNKADLALMKDMVLKGRQPWKQAFENLKKTASLSFRPVAFTHVLQGPYGADDKGGVRF